MTLAEEGASYSAMGDMDVQKRFHDVEIAIVGGGPVGMLSALHLSRFGTPCLLAERNVETTRWPKMDWTNPRSMELFRMMGLADEYRSLPGAVGPDFQMDSIFYYSCNPGSTPIARWVCTPFSAPGLFKRLNSWWLLMRLWIELAFYESDSGQNCCKE